MTDFDLDRFCASLRTAVERRREALAPDEMAGDPRVGRLISEIDTLETILAAVTEATGNELKKAIADRDLKPENIPHPMQPVVMVEGVARFKQNAIVRYLLDWATARGLSLNQIACMPHTKDDYQHLMQLIGYSVSGYGDLNEHDPKICADADALVDAALKDTDEAPLDLRSPMRLQGVTAGFADYIQALKRINSFRGMGEPLNFEYQAGPILLADRVETVVKELEEARKETELRYTFDRNNVIAKAKRDANPTLMMNDAARALGWRTDFACGDSPISWDLVLDGIEDEVITKQVAHKLLVQISNAPGMSTSVKGWIIEYIAKRTERHNEQNIQHERRIDRDQKLERLASMRTIAVAAAHEALINLSKTIRSGPEHEHSWRETVDGLARTILAIFEES